MNRVFLSLGSNINDKVNNINKAVDLLKKNKDIHNLKVSSFYSTDPVGYLDQDVFVNIALEMHTDLKANEVLYLCQTIENNLLRKRIIHWGPRIIDLDIILYGKINLNTKELTIPHKRAFERAFVLVPLLELDNELEINGLKIKELLKTIDKSGVRKIDMDKKALNSIIKKNSTFKVGNVLIGGDKAVIIAGPCSVESREQIIETAIKLKKIGVDILRGGVFKPRTSPYAFQGLGVEGLKYLKEASEITGLPIITECMEEKYLDEVCKYSDIIQIGSRNMYNYPFLKVLSKIEKPVMLKRGFSATIKEWVMSAEYLAAEGKSNIILCERGVRSIDSYTRNMLDLTAVPIMKKETGLPVFVDPSHGIGIRELIYPMSKAAIACGADGIMIEVHLDPDNALCDGGQSLTIENYKELYKGIRSK